MVTSEYIIAYTMWSQDNLQGVSSLCNVGPGIQTQVIELGSKGHQTALLNLMTLICFLQMSVIKFTCNTQN